MKIERVDRNVWRGPHPLSYADLASQNFVAVIDLQASRTEIWKEMFEAKEKGIAVYPLPLSPIFPPSCAATRYIVGALKAFEGRKVLIHCAKGVDRTGYIIAAYRHFIQYWTVDEAIAEWKAKGRSPWLAWWEFQFRRDIPFIFRYLPL